MKSIFFDAIKQENISDILLCGVVDIEDGIAEFIPIMEYMYFKFDTKIIKFESVEQYSKLKIEYVNKLTYKFEDEDMYPANSSIGEIVLTDTMAKNTVRLVEIYGGEQIDNELICYAVSFHLYSEQEIFIDPSFHYGIGIGGEHQKNAWFNNYPNSESYTVPKSIIEL